MTESEQNNGPADDSGKSIGFLNASEKMQISTFEIPLIFLEDLGFSKKRIGAAKDFNRRFVSGFYTRVRGIGDKLSFRGRSQEKLAEGKPEPDKTKSVKTAKSGKKTA